MIIKNFGRIFIPQEYGIEYAKSPQALLVQNGVRIYFSYCVQDGSKKISRVAFVDYDLKKMQVDHFETNVMEDTILGAYDEHGIFPFSPFWDGKEIKALLTGWSRRVSVSVDTSIGLAYSLDGGETFIHKGYGPILTSCMEEPYLIVDGFIYKESDCYHMFYIFGTKWGEKVGQPERTYKIGHLTSNDLYEWQGQRGVQILPDVLNDEAQALPSVVKYNGIYHMFFCYRETYGFRDSTDMSYRLGYAYSDNLNDWIRADERLNFELEDWNFDMQCYPNAFIYNDDVYILYNGNSFGKNGFGLLKIEEWED